MLLFKIDINAIDSNAIILSIVGYLIVFTALVSLYAVFFYLPKLLKLKISLKHQKTKKEAKSEILPGEEELTGEVSAAISMALHLHFNQYHDEENTSMTIKRESRLYSPWSSKIYQVRNQFNRL
jgi:Na+-transporting methylmalonyl-CoA/oxaloacetate decarboxylase gamma subunit